MQFRAWFKLWHGHWIFCVVDDAGGFHKEHVVESFQVVEEAFEGVQVVTTFLEPGGMQVDAKWSAICVVDAMEVVDHPVGELLDVIVGTVGEENEKIWKTF